MPSQRPASRLPALLVSVAALLCFSCLRGEDEPMPPQIELSGKIFGTTWSTKVIGPSPESRPELLQALQRRLEELDAALSTYRDDAELVLLNRSRETSTEISQELHELLALSQEVHRRSEGAFDVTLGPLIELWGFGRRKALDGVPADSVVMELLERTGSDLFQLQPGPTPTIRRSRSDLQIDLSAVAKGYAVDQLHELLVERGFPDHLVEIGGEIRVSGTKADGRAWTLAVESPQTDGRSIARIVQVAGRGALATSGDYRNYYEVDGRRYSHTLDPTTGRPVTHSGASVSVLAETCAEADAWATALLALGPEHGLGVAEQEGVAAFFLTYDSEDREGYSEGATSAWALRELEDPAAGVSP